jgi:putative endonuclease
MRFFVYVLKSELFKRYYVGITNNLSRRLTEHNNGKTRSTRYYLPWNLLFSESFETRTEARKREKYLKSGIGKEYIKKRSGSSAGYLPAGRQGAASF